MKTNIVAASCFLLVAGFGWSAEETSKTGSMPEMPKPQKEHEWLKQIEGEWDSDALYEMETFARL